MDLLLKTTSEFSSSKEIESLGWYNFSRIWFKPLVDKRTETLNTIRQNLFTNDVAKNMAKDVKKHLRDEIKLAKSKWTRCIAENFIIWLILQKKCGNQ